MKCPIDIHADSFTYLRLVCGSLSALGSVFIITYCIWLKTLSVYSYKLIFYFSIGQFLISIEFLFPLWIQSKNKDICSVFGLIINSGQMISALWMTCIAFTILNVFNGFLIINYKHQKYWSIASWIAIPILNCIPIITDDYAPIGRSCTYDRNTNGTIERVLIFFIPVWILLSFSIYCYARIFYMMRSIEINPTLRKMIKSLMYYPILMALNVVILTIERICLYIIHECDLIGVNIVSSILVSLNGFFNFILFLSTPGTLKMIKMKMMAKHDLSSSVFSEMSSTLPVIMDDFSIPH